MYQTIETIRNSKLERNIHFKKNMIVLLFAMKISHRVFNIGRNIYMYTYIS